MILFLFPAFAAELSGTASFNGSAVVSASVYAIDQRQRMTRSFTDQDGQFNFSDLNPGQYRLAIIPPLDSDAVAEFYPGSQSVCEGEPINLIHQDATVHFELDDGIAVMGRVLTREQTPVQSGLVVFENDFSSFGDGAYTDDNGFFSIRGLHPDLKDGWRCVLDIDDMPEQSCDQHYDMDDSEPVALNGQDIDLGTLTPLPGIQVNGQIISGSNPIENAEVLVYSESQVTSTLTDADGLFSVSGLPPGDVLVWSQADGFATIYYPDADRPQDFIPATEEGQSIDNIILDLPQEARLTVLLEDDTTGDPILGTSALLYNDTQTVGKGAPANDEGKATIGGLHGGDYQLQYYAKNDGYSNGWYSDESGERAWVSLSPETDHDLVISLTPTSQLSGKVIDDNGKPVYGAIVKVYSESLTEQTTTNVDGEFIVHGLTPDEYWIEMRYTPLCNADPSYVSLFYPDTPQEAKADTFPISIADQYELILVMPNDDDADGMPDNWEEEHGLDPTRQDHQEDPDQDGIPNIDEYIDGTNPRDQDIKSDNCNGCSGSNNALIFIGLAALYRRRRR